MTTKQTNPLASLHATLTALAAEYSTEACRVRVYYGLKHAQLYLTADTADQVREVLRRMSDDGEAIRATLDGRTVTRHKSRGFLIWNCYDDSGYPVAKRSEIRITMTADEDDAILGGWAASLDYSVPATN